MARALILGCTGQDGYYLTAHLEALGYDVAGLAPDGFYRGGTRVGAALEITDYEAIRDLLAELRPDEIYHLAAHHHASDEDPGDAAPLFEISLAVHFRSLFALLDGMRQVAPSCRLFYAATSLIFGYPETTPQNEDTPFNPVCAYGLTKASGVQLCRYFRDAHGLFCGAGILFTHESLRRRPNFLSRRIVQTAAAIKRGAAGELVIGDLDAVVDWGWAPEFVDAMHRMLRLDAPGDFVIASGRQRRIRDFVEAVFDAMELPCDGHVREDPARMVRRTRTIPLVGDITKLTAATGWRPAYDVGDMARDMVAAELGG